MPIEQRIYLFSQGSEPSFHEVVSGVIERTHTDNLGVLAVIKPSDPEQSRTIETCGEILPTKFCGARPWRLGQAVKVFGGWLHVFDVGAEKAYYEYKENLRKAEEELRLAERERWKAYYAEEEAKLINSYLNTKTSEDILVSLVGKKLLRFCRASDEYLTLEFEGETVTISYSVNRDESGTLTLTKGSP